MTQEFLAFVTDEISYATAYAWAEKQGFPVQCIQKGGPNEAGKSLETSMPPQLLLVDVDGLTDPVAPLEQIVLHCGKDTKVVAIGTANDVGLYRRFLTAGISDYIVKPLTPEQLSQSMAQVLRGDNLASGQGTKDARVIVMIGVRGGVGVSTLALNTAWSLAHDEGRQTALVDLDLRFGSASLSLDLEPGHGFRDLVSSPQRVDSLMISSSIVPAIDRLSVLGTEEPVDDVLMVDGAAVTELMKEMRASNDYIIVDLPRHMIPTQKRLLAAAHEIVLVSELSLIGIRDTLRIKTALKSLGCPARVTVAATKASAQRPPQVDEGTFTKGVQARLDFSFPDDFKNLSVAANAGKSLLSLAPHSPLAKTIQSFVHHLMGPTFEEEPKKKGFLGWLGGSKKSEEAE